MAFFPLRSVFFQLATAVILLVGADRTSAAVTPDDLGPEDINRGRSLFRLQCAGCHGYQGFGGMGPSLARPKLRHAVNFDSLVGVIARGIPGTSMTPTRMFSNRERRQVAGYVRTLGEVAETPLPGNAERGRALVLSKAACLTCHSVAGEGGITGPDLTEIGRRRGPEYLHRVLVGPGAEKSVSELGYFEYLAVRLVTRNGSEINGVRLNEDGFTIQVRDAENRLRSFRKSDLQQLTKTPTQNIMPGFAATFTAPELDDVVAYLVSLRGDS